MNIKFEWSEFSGPFGPQFRCWCGPVWVGQVLVYADDIAGMFGGDDRALTPLMNNGFMSLHEAKAWVEQQAREWLASVTQEVARNG